MDVDGAKDIHKRINQTTGKPFQKGDVDISGRVFENIITRLVTMGIISRYGLKQKKIN